MEIEIPDLNDVEFVTKCGWCRGDDVFGAPMLKTCERCNGGGKELTPVGERLIDFLKSLGIHIPNEDGWRN